MAWFTAQQVAALDLDMAFDAPGFIHGMPGSVFGDSGKASHFVERKTCVVRWRCCVPHASVPAASTALSPQRRRPRAKFDSELQVGMDAEVFDKLQFWEYLNLMEVKRRPGVVPWGARTALPAVFVAIWDADHAAFLSACSFMSS